MKEPMQRIVEAADECYHSFDKAPTTSNLQYNLNHKVCKCGKVIVIGIPDSEFNPSPTDLNELFRLADKLEIGVRTDSQESCYLANVWNGDISTTNKSAINLADALLNALAQAIQEVL